VKQSLSHESVRGTLERLKTANDAFGKEYPGEHAGRQPVHTCYVGAQDFHEGTVASWQKTALDAWGQIDWKDMFGDVDIADRVKEKLETEPIEDLRVDFEDGYGVRPDAEEDQHAVAAAQIMKRGKMPPCYGIRIKPFNEDLKARSIRTLDVFLTELGEPPPGFVITLAKVTVPEQVSALADLLDLLAPKVPFEIMIETAQSVIGPRGEIMIPALITAARGRCVAAHFGTFDFTASAGVTAAHQGLMHPVCDYAKHALQVSLAGRGVWLSDGSTMVLPVGDNAQAAWKRHAREIRHSLVGGFYQGWDMHPAQLPTRFGAVYAFFREALPSALHRMKTFVAKASAASAEAGIIDDAATGQALLNFFLRGIHSGAMSEDEVLATGLTREEIRGRSFPRILEARSKRWKPV
jgi:citrate lyase beta subunit